MCTTSSVRSKARKISTFSQLSKDYYLDSFPALIKEDLNSKCIHVSGEPAVADASNVQGCLEFQSVECEKFIKKEEAKKSQMQHRAKKVDFTGLENQARRHTWEARAQSSDHGYVLFEAWIGVSAEIPELN